MILAASVNWLQIIGWFFFGLVVGRIAAKHYLRWGDGDYWDGD